MRSNVVATWKLENHLNIHL